MRSVAFVLAKRDAGRLTALRFVEETPAARTGNQTVAGQGGNCARGQLNVTGGAVAVLNFGDSHAPLALAKMLVVRQTIRDPWLRRLFRGDV